jgi:hypothetical protein
MLKSYYDRLQEKKRFKRDLKFFQEQGGVPTSISPMYGEWAANAGNANGHYFHQDLLVASFIHDANPKRHIDIGSRIDGFVAHVASFRKISVIDIRNLSLNQHPNINFEQMDFMGSVPISVTDSISSLHAIEHFGLGRYGDAIEPNGHLIAFKNLLSMLELNGTLYVSFPISQKSKVIFNMHRIFDPFDIFTWSNDITLKRFDFIDDKGDLSINANINRLPFMEYGCGIYTLIKES